MAAQHKFIFRRASIPDIKIVIEMIQELADFEEMSKGPTLTEKDLMRDSGLEGDRECCHVYVLELEKGDMDRVIIGYSICFFSYSTWQGRTYFMEDIYVRPDYRRMGAGSYMIRQVANKALEYECKRLDFHVLGWNPARAFYEKMGAVDLTTSEDWHFYRIEADVISKLSKEL